MRKQTKANYDLCRKIIMGAAILLLMVMGCDNSTSPNQDLKTSQDIPVTMQSGDAVNATHEELPIYTADGFYFLPPMIKDSEYSGTFDPTLSPVVEICETPACNELHATFDMNGEGSERVRVDEDDEHYIVNWNTNSSGAETGQTYRVRVLVNGTTLGHANVHVVRNGREANQHRSAGEIAIVANQTLPVKFRVETGIEKSGFFLAENGITILCPDAQPGDKGFVGVVEYEAVDRDLLIQRRDEGADLTRVCTTRVTDMSAIFFNMGSFDQDIGGWDTGNVTNMYEMFFNVTVFNQDIGGWDTANVSDMSSMFSGASSFDQPIGGWNTDNVKKMNGMFAYATSFNQHIGNWDTHNVTDMTGMFYYATDFNQYIGGWDTGRVTNMIGMFRSASSFNQDIGDWDTKNVTNMRFMFLLATSFNGDISRWNTGNVMDMVGMFAVALSFNQPIGGWDTGNVMNMNQMFSNANSFNHDIGGWNTENVNFMGEMFNNASSFNQDIGGWDTGKVTNMSSMFRDATSFNRNLSGWCVSLISEKPTDFDTGAASWVLPRPDWGTCPQ